MMATVPALRFELGRLSRRWGLWVVWAALCAVAVAELVNLPDRVPSPVRLWPLPVAYLASWGLAADLRRGGMDILICAGVRPTKLMLLRAGIAAVMGLALMALLIVPPLVRDPSQLGICIDLAVVALYWASVGAAMGFFIPSAGVVALAVIMVIGEGWWVTLGSGWLLNTLPPRGLRQPLPWRFIC